MAGKTSANTERDIAMYMSDIEKIIRQYRDLYAKAQAVQHKKGKDEERATIMTKRKELKGEFIRSKQACRALFKLLPPEHAEDREKALEELQKDFRAADTDIKELNMQVDRAALGLGTSNSTPNSNESAAGAGTGLKGHTAVPLNERSNNELLRGALSIEKDTTEQLRQGLAVAKQTEVVGAEVTQKLAEDKEKINKISGTLDDVQGELRIAQKLLTTLMKRLYTDKILIALVFLIVVGIITIIVYSTVHKDQKIFNVPDVIKPPSAAQVQSQFSGGSASPSPAGSPG